MVDPSTAPSKAIFCTEEEVLHLLLAIDLSKASGPDGISRKIFKNTAISIFPALTRFLNLSISAEKISHRWKVSSVVPVQKFSNITLNFWRNTFLVWHWNT